jgi:hypothetical protein
VFPFRGGLRLFRWLRKGFAFLVIFLKECLSRPGGYILDEG